MGTKNAVEARILLNARNESHRQPILNLQIARTYLAASDPEIARRTWRAPLDAMQKLKLGVTGERCVRVTKDPAIVLLLDRPLLETRAEHLFQALEAGTVSTNVFLRRLHNFALNVGWLPWPIIHKLEWPAVRYREKRAITLAEHQAVLSAETNPLRRAFYELCWLLGGSQTDVAFLGGENVDWSNKVISFHRRKTNTVSMVHFGDEVERVLRTLPAEGPYFPQLRKMNSGHRATEFTRVCRRAGVTGVTLHCYRYAWAERAKQVGYPERFAQEALGHNSKAVHRAYSRKAKIRLPSLEAYEKQAAPHLVAFQPGAVGELTQGG